MPYNIEKSAFRRGEYVGYGGGALWRISRPHRRAQWVAVSDVGGYMPCHRDTLQEISDYIGGF